MFRSITRSTKSLSPLYYSAYHSSPTLPDSVNSVASTSASTLDDPLPKPRTQFERLLPDYTTSPITNTKPKSNGKPNKRRAPKHIIPQLGALADDQLVLDDLPNLGPTKFDPSHLSPHLPLVTRERNFFLSELHLCLRSPRPSARATWQALVPILQYPNTLPHLPLAFHPQSTRSSTPDANTNTDHEPRSPITLSLAELRRAFSILARERARSREGLARLLVVVELIAQHAATSPLPPATEPFTGARTQAVGQLRGEGAGLRAQDWTALMLFAAASFRSPRAAPEVEDAFGLFAQWERKQARAVGERWPSPGQLQAAPPERTRTAMFNALLLVAMKARSWALFELTERRRADARVPPDAYTFGIRLEKQARRGAPVEVVWAAFGEGLAFVSGGGRRGSVRGGEDAGALWNMMLWALIRRGLIEEGMGLYRILQEGKPVSLQSLLSSSYPAAQPSPYADSPSPILSLLSDPTPHPAAAPPTPDLLVTPPPPTLATYAMLIQALAHHGDLRACLILLRDLVTAPPSAPAHRAGHARPARLRPTAHMFTCLFKGFAVHGAPPAGHAAWAADPHLLAGRRQRQNQLAQAETARPLDALARLGTSASSRVAGLAGAGSGSGPKAATPSNAWTWPALQALLRSFLALEPPQLDAAGGALPHEGGRTAPSSKELFWLLLAVERLTGGDSRAVLQVWEAVEGVFGRGRRGGDRKEVWTGWRVDKRLAGKVERHRKRVEEGEQEEEDGRA